VTLEIGERLDMLEVVVRSIEDSFTASAWMRARVTIAMNYSAYNLRT